MNNKVKAEKHRILPIASLVTGILAFGIAFLLFVFIGPRYGFGNFIPEEFIWIFVLSFMVICFVVPAIVCGSIDLKRSKAGLFRNKIFKGMDIAGIVLGSVFILIAAAVFLPGSVTNYEPVWSPDGTKLAFTSQQDGVATNYIWVMDADGSDQTRLTK